MQTIQLLAVSALDSRPAAETLVGLARSGVDLNVLAPAGAAYLERLALGGVKAEELPAGGARERGGAALIRGRLREGPADILYLDGVTRSLLVGLAGRRLGARVVVRLRYLDGHRRPSMLRRLIYRAGNVAKVIADIDPARVGDPRTARWLGERLCILPSGHDTGWYAPGHDLAALGIPEHALAVAAMTARPDPGGLRWLVESARSLPMDVPIHFLLVAPRSSHERLRLSIRRIPFTQRFHLSDAVEQGPGLLASCSLAVLTDWGEELQRRACRQCLALGVPVLAGDVAPVEQVIRTQINGELLPPGDPVALAHSIFELYEEKDRRLELGARAERLARQAPSMAEAVAARLAVLQGIVASSQGAGRAREV